jgi:D-alanyl-D-alanine carboxypeptidase (penicillin-binding protein 5/6)
MHGAETPVPTASTAKLITALTVLQQKPLKAGEQGPTVTLHDSDVALYNNYVAQDGSLVKVQAGEQISEYQMLQTMMLPSANNIADSIAIWAFGSLQNYASAANQYLSSLGLVTTHVGSDASGLSPTTTSTAHDMVQIGELVMKDPVLSGIVGQSTASGIPVVGTITNVNMLLGTDNIIGIKTGNSDQAGGAFVSASRTTVNGKQVTVVTALMDSPSLFQAMKDSLPLIRSAQNNFSTTPVVRARSTVGSYTAPWGGSVKAVATNDVSATLWNGSTVSPQVSLKKTDAKTTTHTTIGTVSVPASPFSNRATSPVELQSSPPPPSIGWRLSHPF